MWRAIPILLLAACGSSSSTTVAANVRVVTQKSVTYTHYATIQAAVDAAAANDWIIIDAGTYSEKVKITKPGLHLRGMDRNKVILDGKHMSGNGIEVQIGGDGVWIENLTVHDFDRPELDGEDGNQIWWNGGDGSGTIGMHGWYGSYLTTYSTGLLGGYGIFASNAVTGALDQVYASGFNDSGLYVGACRDCQADIGHALVENNALGYSGTNSGGHLVIHDSTFQNNSNGVGPNSLNNDDQPPPQDGACDSGQNTSPTPTMASTGIERCTIFKNNVVKNNSNFTTPANSTTAGIPWGNGFVLIGSYGDLIDSNMITGNPSAGVLGFENPNPFPPTADTVFFQLAGNRISNNTFSGNATNADANAADVVLVGGLFGTMQSTNNCATGNTLTKTVPANLQTAWGCDKTTTPNPGGDALSYVLALQTASQARTSVAQPAPPAQTTMPNPCKDVPTNPLCD